MSSGNPHVTVGSPSREEPVITIRPDPFALLVCALLALAAGGCSARVETESSKWASPPPASSASDATTGEKAKTTVEVDLLQPRPSEPPPPKPTSSANTVILNLGDGDIHVHQPPARAEADGKPARPRNGLNTKIGFPSTYRQHSPLAFLGSMAVCLLVGTAVVLLVATVGRTESGPMLSLIGLLTLAAILLQALPASESGIQFIPLSPWAYSGLVAICLSILRWLGVFLAALIAILSSGLIGAPSGFSAAVLFSMGCSLLLSLGGGSAPTEVASACFATGPVSSESQISTGEKGRTAVPVDLLQSRSQEPVATPKPPEALPPLKPAPLEAKPLNISGNTFVFSFRGSDTHNEMHINVQEAPRPRVEERITVHRDAKAKPPRPVDERCERLAREHEERVRRWRSSPN